MMVFNVVVFICVVVVLIRHTRNKAARMGESVSRSTIVRLMISIGGVMFLFGLTWLFALLTFNDHSGYQIPFIVFNSFQGLFIFLFICVFNKESIESWKEVLTCGKYQSSLLHPSMGMLSAPKHTKTGNTALSSSNGVKTSISVTTKSECELNTLKKEEFECEPDIVKVPLSI